MEEVVTFLFVLTVLSVKVSKAASSTDGALKCFTVAAALFALITFAGPVSGGCLNPAVGFVQIVFVNKSQMKNLVWYLGGTCIGGIIAGLFMRFVHVPVLESVPAEGKASTPDTEAGYKSMDV